MIKLYKEINNENNQQQKGVFDEVVLSDLNLNQVFIIKCNNYLNSYFIILLN